jgi:hypothetical protein
MAFDFGPITAELDASWQDFTSYRVETDTDLLVVEQTSWPQDAASLAADTAARMNGMYGGAADVTVTTPTLLGQDVQLVSGTVPTFAEDDPAAPATATFAVALLPAGLVAQPAIVSVAYSTVDPGAGAVDLIANLANANSGGAVAPGLVRVALGPVQYDVAAYTPPPEFRFGIDESLVARFVFGTANDLPTPPEGEVWFDESSQQLNAEVVDAEAQVAIGDLQGTAGRWLVHRQLTDGTAVDDWAVWRLFFDLANAVRVQVTVRASGDRIADAENQWAPLLGSIVVKP